MPTLNKIKLGTDGTTYELVDSTARANISTLEKYVAENHNNIYRGNSIQTYFDNGSLYTKISKGTFDDLFIGDYFKASYGGYTILCYIAGINTYYGPGPGNDYYLTRPHVVVVTSGNILDSFVSMNSTHTTVGGYLNSDMNKKTIGDVATIGSTSTVNKYLYGIFGSHLLSKAELLSSSINETAPAPGNPGSYGASNGWTKTTCQAVLMSEIELNGSTVYSSSGFDTGTANMQLPLFRLAPSHRNTMGTNVFWLRDVGNIRQFCQYGFGVSGCNSAGTTAGVRPRFIIG